MDPLARPTIGDVVLLLALQIGLSVLAVVGTWLVAKPAQAAAPFAGVFLGALAFTALKRRHRTPMSSSCNRRLALWGTIVWGSVAGAMVLLIKYVYAPDSGLPGPWLLFGWAVLLLCYAGLTLFGLWAGSRRGAEAAATRVDLK